MRTNGRIMWCYQTKSLGLLVLYLIISSQSQVSALSINSFFSFGSANGDSSLPDGDDEVVSQDFPSPFFFYGQTYTSFGVTTNGLITLNETLASYTPVPFPTTNPRIAPFWGDADTTGGIGNVYYRSTSEQALLNEANNIISSVFEDSDFVSQYLTIVTWFEVGYYQAHGDKAVLAANSESSYVLFLYKDGGIQWTTGDVNNSVLLHSHRGGNPATVGFNAGDMINFVTVTGSSTDAVINIASTTNIGIPGIWAFQVNQAQISAPDPCLSGPCDQNAYCQQIGVTSDFSCICIPPYFGNGTFCTNSIGCDPPCHRDAVCTITSSGGFGCQCKAGYGGDGINSCEVSTSIIGGVLGALFFLLTSMLMMIVCICCYFKCNSHNIKEKKRLRLGIKGRRLDAEFGDSISQQKFSVQTSYKFKLPPHIIIHSSTIKLLEPIGQGEFGIVYKGHLINLKDPGHVVADVVAIKTLKGFYDKSTVREMMKECSKMYKFDHPNVLALKGVCLDGGPAPYIIMPFMANGSLLAHLHKNRDSLVVINRERDDDEVNIIEKQLMDMCLQIAKGMEYLTLMKVIHRDLAARNCMIDINFVIKVADFGLSESIGTKQYFRQDKLTGIKLPIKWLAPESLEDCIFSQKSDVWAYGVTCWEVFTGGKTPYPGISPTDLPRQVASGHRLEKPINTACSDEMYAFMLDCWNVDPNARPSFSDLVSSLSQSLETMVGYMDVTTPEKYELEKSSVPVKVPFSEDYSSNLSKIASDVCVETLT